MGGVQKNVVALASSLSDEYETVLLLTEDDKPILYTFDEKVRCCSLKTRKLEKFGFEEGLFLFEDRKKQLKDFLDLEKPDMVVSFEDYQNIVLAESGYKGKKIFSGRISINDFYDSFNIHLLPKSFYIEKMIQHYHKADVVVTVSSKIAESLKKLDTRINTRVVYNGVDLQSAAEAEKIDIGYDYILSVGRLHPQKGFHVLIEAYKMISEMTDKKLCIIGEGKLRRELECLIAEYKMEDKVKLLGEIKDVIPYMKSCSMFVFPSNFEGFSNTILEAMASGCGVISSDYEGYDEVLHDYGNIFHCGDVNSLKLKMEYFTNNPEELKIIADKQLHDVSVFSSEKSINSFCQVIKEVM
jgi:glycosyltransferase involved in cell wall biosynthesis